MRPANVGLIGRLLAWNYDRAWKRWVEARTRALTLRTSTRRHLAAQVEREAHRARRRVDLASRLLDRWEAR
jgi:hypothetical protein